jgi:putative FmdB family regulatory protein
MPTYEYKCLDCGDRFDVFQSMKDERLSTCRKCKGKLQRLIGTGAGIIFKGSGFYCTDYRSESYKQAKNKDASTPTPSGSGSESAGKTNGSSSATGAGSSSKGEKTP